MLQVATLRLQFIFGFCFLSIFIACSQVLRFFFSLFSKFSVIFCCFCGKNLPLSAATCCKPAKPLLSTISSNNNNITPRNSNDDAAAFVCIFSIGAVATVVRCLCRPCHTASSACGELPAALCCILFEICKMQCKCVVANPLLVVLFHSIFDLRDFDL